MFETVRSMTDPALPESWRSGAFPAVLAGSAIGIVIAGLLVSLRARRPEYTFLAGVTAGSVGFAALGHFCLAMPYPSDRTGLYLVPLSVMPVAAVLGARLPRWSAAAGVVFVLAVALWASQLRVSYFEVWRSDAGSREVYDVIAASGRPVRVATSRWLFAPALEFYRVTRADGHVALITDEWTDLAYDYFVLAPNDPALAAVRTVATPVLRHPISGALVLERRLLHHARRSSGAHPGQRTGCFACHRVACSYAWPTPHRTDSLNRRPTNCTLSGRPSAEKPQGTDKVGLPLRLNGWV
jgi:hypothetical protein